MNKFILLLAFLFISINSQAAGWKLFANHVVDAYGNSLPGGNVIHQECAPAGMYRFRIDSTSKGFNMTGVQTGYPLSKSVAIMVLNRSDSNNLGQVFHYGLNMSTVVDGLPSSVIHAAPGTACMGYDVFIDDWYRGDNTGSLNLIVEQWQ